MPIPKTYLMTAPTGENNPFGRGISSAEIGRKLKKLEPLIWVQENTTGIWWPGKAQRITSLWYAHNIGEMGDTIKSTKITAFNYGVIPEFTQLEPYIEAGKVVDIARKGWRAIFAAVPRAVPTISTSMIERAFHVTLDYASEDASCKVCRREGATKPHNGGKNRMCGFHDGAYKAAFR